MKKIIPLIVLFIFGMGFTGCSILFSSSETSSSSSSYDSSYSSSTNNFLIKKWTLEKVYFKANSNSYNNRYPSNSWIQFNSNGTCNQTGLFSTKSVMKWSVKGKKLTIWSSTSFNYADDNLNSNEVTYDIEFISANELHLSRWDGKNPNGANITRHLILRRAY